VANHTVYLPPYPILLFSLHWVTSLFGLFSRSVWRLSGKLNLNANLFGWVQSQISSAETVAKNRIVCSLYFCCHLVSNEIQINQSIYFNSKLMAHDKKKISSLHHICVHCRVICQCLQARITSCRNHRHLCLQTKFLILSKKVKRIFAQRKLIPRALSHLLQVKWIRLRPNCSH